jgi:hypothetical protein
MLCRACGNELIAFEYCPECNEAIHWKCSSSSCERENEKSVHTHNNMQKVQEFSKKASVAGAAAVATLVSGLSSIILIA